MNVGELIAELQKLDPELLVVKQKDDEGNGYHKLHTVDGESYVDNEHIDSYYLEVLCREGVREMAELYGDGENCDMDGYTQVCVLV